MARDGLTSDPVSTESSPVRLGVLLEGIFLFWSVLRAVPVVRDMLG